MAITSVIKTKTVPTTDTFDVSFVTSCCKVFEEYVSPRVVPWELSYVYNLVVSAFQVTAVKDTICVVDRSVRTVASHTPAAHCASPPNGKLCPWRWKRSPSWQKRWRGSCSKTMTTPVAPMPCLKTDQCHIWRNSTSSSVMAFCDLTSGMHITHLVHACACVRKWM